MVTNKSIRYFFLDSYSLVVVLNALVRKSSDLFEIHQTQQCSNVFIQVRNICFTDTHGRNFVVKCGGGQLGVKPISSSGRCRSNILYIKIPNLISRGVLRSTLIILCFVLADDLHIQILKFVAGHGTVVQPASINIVFGCK